MKRTRIINLIALFVNLAIFAAFFAGFYFKFIEPCVSDFKKFNEIGSKMLSELRYYEFIAAIITMLASLFMMFCNGKSAKRMRDSTPGWIFTLRYISMGMSILIVVVTIMGIAVNDGVVQDPEQYINFTGHKFYWCLVMPVLSIVSFIFLELEPKCKFRKNFGPLITWVIYCATILVFMFILIPKKGIEYVAKDFSPYFIFLLTKDLIAAQEYWNVNQSITISIFVIVTVFSFVLPILLRLLNRLMSNLIIGYEYVEIDGEDNIVRPINKVETTKEKKKAPAKPIVYDNVYRVSVYDRKLRTWKVVLPNKTVKLFNTQQEALAYASNAARKSKGSVRIHAALAKLKFENQ